MAADKPVWHIKYNGKDYTFCAQDQLGVTELRRFKQWFPHLGTYLSFVGAVSEGDPDAACCVAWIVQRAANEEVPEPDRITDIKPGTFYDKFEPAGFIWRGEKLVEVEEGEVKEEDPTNTAPNQTLASTAIPTKSEPSTSPSSPTSAT